MLHVRGNRLASQPKIMNDKDILLSDFRRAQLTQDPQLLIQVRDQLLKLDLSDPEYLSMLGMVYKWLGESELSSTTFETMRRILDRIDPSKHFPERYD